MSEKERQYEFVGNVAKCIYDSSNFRVYALDVDTKKYEDIKKNNYGNVRISGEIPELTIGTQYEIIATETESKYGISYKVLNIKRDEPKSEEDMKIFLEEILTSNQADVLYANYPDIVQRVKNNDLEDIDLSKLHGIGEKTFEKIKRKIIENFKLTDLVVEFKGVLSLSIIRKIYDKYTSIELLKEKLKYEPYACLTGISGIGFKTADSIVIQLQKENIIDFGYDVKTSLDRCLSCIIYLLQENEDEGNTKMNLADLRKACIKLAPACADKFVEAVKSDGIYYNKTTMDVGFRRTYEEECLIAQAIVYGVNKSNIWDFEIEKYRNVGEFELTDEQMLAISNVCKHSISILNGAGGTGKSFTTQSIINMLNDNRMSFKLFSPTGKAAKVLADYTKEDVSTIHRGLGYNPRKNSWEYNVYNKLDCDIVIVDEFSMVDVKLFKRLIDAINLNKTKLLIIGDNAQLPSVSCGNILHDLMETNLVPTVTLTKVHRYGEGGLMKVATDTRCCKTYLNKTMKDKATSFGINHDYMFIDLPSEAIPVNAAALYKKLLDKGNSVKDIQVLTAKNIGDYGSMALNAILQKVANPNYGSSSYMKVGDTTYYVGDFIIQCKNNYEVKLNVDDTMYCEFDCAFIANGETGIIKEIYKDYVVIDFDGVHVRYSRGDMTTVKLGYAITIHKSQGSSVDNVILCTPRSHTFMLNSNLLYVGLTRMRKNCYHLGSLNSVNQAIHKKENLERHTFMQQLLLDMAG